MGNEDDKEFYEAALMKIVPSTMKRKTRKRKVESYSWEDDTEKVFKALKRKLKVNPAQVTSVFYPILFSKIIQTKDSDGKMALLKLMDTLFLRSEAFRYKLLQDAQLILPYFLANLKARKSQQLTRKEKLVKKRSSCSSLVPSEVEQYFLHLLEEWQFQFAHISQLNTVLDYVLSKGYVLPQVRQNQQLLKEIDEKERRLEKRKLQCQFKQMQQRVSETSFFIKDEIQEINSLFHILIPAIEDTDRMVSTQEGNESILTSNLEYGKRNFDSTTTQTYVNDSEDDIEWETATSVVEDEQEFGNQCSDDDYSDSNIDINTVAQQYGLGSREYNLEIKVSTKVAQKDTNNAILFDLLTERIQVLTKKYAPLLKEWTEILRKRTCETSFTERALAEQVVVLSGLISDAIDKYNDLIKE